MQYLMSVDIGTTALKSCLVSRSGEIIASESRGYPLESSGNTVEQNPRLWWEAFCSASRSLITGHPDIPLDAVVLSGQMQDLIYAGDDAIGNAVLYSDTRAQAESERCIKDLGMDFLKGRTCNTPDASSLPPKIMHTSEERMRAGESVGILLGAHDYVCRKLSGRAVTDLTNAATTGMMNYRANSWDKDILGYLGIREDQLPRLEAADSITGTVTPEAARERGLPAGLPVIHGAGDAGSSTIGAGAGTKGVTSCYLGTSGWIAGTVDAPADPASGVFNLRHPDGKRTIAIGAMRTTGGNISWLLKTFEILDDPYGKLQEIASRAPIGSGGVFYLPYLQGERAPFNDPNARGSFIGLSQAVDKTHLFRSVIEGISYGLATIYEVIAPDSQTENRRLIVSGGGAEHGLLTRIIADVIGVSALTVKDAANSGILGNAVIAGKALGWFDSFALPEGFLQIQRTIEPDPDSHRLYIPRVAEFKRLYQALHSEFHYMAHFL